MTLQLFYYVFTAIASCALLGVYLFRWHKHLDAHMSVIFGLVPLVNMAYMMMYMSKDDGEVIAFLKICYLGGCFLPWVITMCVAGLCNIKVNRYLRVGTFLLGVVFYALVLSVGYSSIFYETVMIRRTEDLIVISKYYGPAHTAYYAVLFLYLALDLVLIVLAYKNLKNVSRRVLLLMYIPVPPHRTGTAPRLRISAYARRKSCWNCHTLYCVPGSAMSMRWQGISPYSARSLPVPMSIPRYTWRESAEMISPPSARASATA